MMQLTEMYESRHASAKCPNVHSTDYKSDK